MKKNNRKNNSLKNIVCMTVFFLASFQFASASEITSDNVIKLVNEARIEGGMPVLETSSDLDEIAKEKASDMVENNYFAHTSPKGLTPWYWFGKNGYDYHYAGENLAINFQNAEDEQTAWMNSPTHRKNILNPDYREIGVAVISGKIDGKPAIIAVQEFGTRVSGTSKPDRNETAGKDSDAIKDGDRIAPAVLSVKNTGNDGGSGNGQAMADNKGKAVSEFLRSVPAYLALAIMIAIPLTLILESWSQILDSLKNMKVRIAKR